MTRRSCDRPDDRRQRLGRRRRHPGRLKTFAALGVYGTSAITAITAQNTVGVTAVSAVAADIVTAQIEAVAGDIEMHATQDRHAGDGGDRRSGGAPPSRSSICRWSSSIR